MKLTICAALAALAAVAMAKPEASPWYGYYGNPYRGYNSRGYNGRGYKRSADAEASPEASPIGKRSADAEASPWGKRSADAEASPEASPIGKRSADAEASPEASPWYRYYGYPYRGYY